MRALVISGPGSARVQDVAEPGAVGLEQAAEALVGPLAGAGGTGAGTKIHINPGA